VNRSEPYLARYGFWKTKNRLSETAASRIGRAPGSMPKFPPSPSEIRATPQKLTAVPIQPSGPSRSPRNAAASRAVKTGTEEMMRLAAPASTVTSPKARPVW
jgi:hypothetical protein